ncbi:MAG: exo-beta-N-acetylmuramidase NamZ family protein [Rubripirellula sp.]
MKTALTAIVCLGMMALLCNQPGWSQVLAGIDVLEQSDFQDLSGRKVGLITNHTGTNLKGQSTVTLLLQATNVDLVTLFSPEHGFAGKLDQAKIGDTKDSESGLKIFSLYGATKTPTPRSLEGLDTLVFDIQDIGTRFYTYISTMKGAMETASEHGLRFVVLDRPNPIDGIHVQGPVLDAGSESFVGCHTLPVRHGMTTGEIAGMLKTELELELDLVIVPLQGWQRDQMFDSTGRLWIDPSPNMRSLTEAILYPGMGLWETTNVSVGRGTDTPFERLGAPWIDAAELARHLNSNSLPGVAFIPFDFTPSSSKHANQSCGGINIMITDRKTFQPLHTGLAIAVALRKLYPDDWDTTSLNRLLGNSATEEAILEGLPLGVIIERYQAELDQFKSRRARHLLYP